MKKQKWARRTIQSAVDIVEGALPEDIAELGVSAEDWAATPQAVREGVWRRLMELARGLELNKAELEGLRRFKQLFDERPMGSVFGLPMGGTCDVSAFAPKANNG